MITTPLKIFIVDDDNMMLEMLRDRIGQHASNTVLTFSTGEDCLKHVAENPDVIILDYYLNSKNPDASNGMEILKAIKKYNPNIHVIFLSGQERYGVVGYHICFTRKGPWVRTPVALFLLLLYYITTL